MLGADRVERRDGRDTGWSSAGGERTGGGVSLGHGRANGVGRIDDLAGPHSEQRGGFDQRIERDRGHDDVGAARRIGDRRRARDARPAGAAAMASCGKGSTPT